MRKKDSIGTVDLYGQPHPAQAILYDLTAGFFELVRDERLRRMTEHFIKQTEIGNSNR